MKQEACPNRDECNALTAFCEGMTAATASVATAEKHIASPKVQSEPGAKDLLKEAQRIHRSSEKLTAGLIKDAKAAGKLGCKTCTLRTIK